MKCENCRWMVCPQGIVRCAVDVLRDDGVEISEIDERGWCEDFEEVIA